MTIGGWIGGWVVGQPLGHPTGGLRRMRITELPRWEHWLDQGGRAAWSAWAQEPDPKRHLPPDPTNLATQLFRDHDTANQVFRALLARATTGDTDAAWAVLILLRPGLHAAAAQLRALGADIDDTLIQSCWVAITTAPLHRWHSGYPTALLRAARRQAITELAATAAPMPPDTPAHPNEQPIDDLILRAATNHVITPEQADLLFDLIAAEHDGRTTHGTAWRPGAGTETVAAARHTTTRTIRRHRAAAIAALRGAA